MQKHSLKRLLLLPSIVAVSVVGSVAGSIVWATLYLSEALPANLYKRYSSAVCTFDVLRLKNCAWTQFRGPSRVCRPPYAVGS